MFIANALCFLLISSHAVNRVVSTTKDRRAMRILMTLLTEQMTKEQKDEESKAVREKLFKMSIYKNAQRIGTYLSTPEEVGTVEILERMAKDNKKVFTPKASYLDPRDFSYNRLINGTSNFTEVKLNMYEIGQPELKNQQLDALETGGLDLLLIPGFAFSENGCRLSDRQAIFDRYVMKLQDLHPNATVIGLAWKHQMVDAIPQFNEDIERQDVRVNIILHA